MEGLVQKLYLNKNMLTQETKRKIDSARQILVGKVPDPKAQVEQITTALIYKFMDDMDKESQELGGKARFFTNGYQKYAWSKLLDAKLSGYERQDLYLEGLEKLKTNPKADQLFRDIFKDAFLPYRSPETLSMFLKEINGFIYEHSEDLGDAFEYLLSILGSQGDAGQFRTPRHIIDFIVAAVAPKKDETICDPACGTAGFLISAFKHILKENKEKSLTPDERKNLMDHFVGYDISPDMVRLSKVNLYLHGFPNPTIFEYDTLSSEEKWDENFDVMLANPPFMSPTGGIRPHKRFSVQANRSEVLFVDYILEHLRPNGRAGIIVPEGIIFQSANAYKALRKLLIEDGLLAVVSLPAGVFNPYAGVKTSILLFDNGLAKKTKEILFLKIQNDGYGLGAQRREHDKNDLPQALEIIKKYKAALKNGEKFKLNAEQAEIAHLVAKEKIAESGDYNLSGDRYIEAVNFANQKWPMVELGEVCEIYQPKTITSKEIKQTGKYKVFGANGVIGFYDKYNHEDTEVLITCRGATCGTVNMSEPKSWITGNAMVVKPKDNLDKNFLFYFLRNTNLKSVISGSAQPQITRASLSPFKIPLPPLEVQKEIVEQIEVKQKAIEAAKAVIENLERERRYFGQEIRKIKGVEWVKLGEVADFFEDGNWIESKDQAENGIRLVQTGNIGIGEYLDKAGKSRFVSEDTFQKLKCTEIFEGDILISRLPDPVGRACLLPKLETRAITAVDCTIVRFDNKKVIPKFFLAYSMTGDYFSSLAQYLTGASRQRISRLNLGKIKIPLLPLEIQKRLAAEMEEQEKIIEANKKLVGIMEQKIAEVLSEI